MDHFQSPRHVGNIADEDKTISGIMAQLPEERFNCFALAANALRLAIDEYRCKQQEILE